MGRHGREEFDSRILIFLCKGMLFLLVVVQLLFLHDDIRQELSLVDRLEGITLVEGRIDERSLLEKILATILPLWAGK
ncbi:MAG: hypothetical protein IJN28_02625 [Selenomonadales bacterium]|nr:hypothetical protein [Selenomonadales bacterium]